MPKVHERSGTATVLEIGTVHASPRQAGAPFRSAFGPAIARSIGSIKHGASTRISSLCSSPSMTGRQCQTRNGASISC